MDIACHVHNPREYSETRPATGFQNRAVQKNKNHEDKYLLSAHTRAVYFFQPPIVLLRKYEIRWSQICASRDCCTFGNKIIMLCQFVFFFIAHRRLKKQPSYKSFDWLIDFVL